ncbi:DUF1622 domain-containing protein [Streptomyces sp. NPDC002476]|uniref:DUF1622 domain-containing protein n=1 Tax=Streptomyces sp. NPDC002476 TaxID=3364648 RepID=UPI0036B34447
MGAGDLSFGLAGARCRLLPRRAAARGTHGRSRNSLDDYRLVRQRLGRTILLGPEFLVAGDIIGRSPCRPRSRVSVSWRSSCSSERS